MSFETDLATTVRKQLDQAGIEYGIRMDLGDLVARYYEMQVERVEMRPREVLFSKELHESLGKLANEPLAKQRKKSLDAWNAVFLLRDLLKKGENVVSFLSRNINQLACKDDILWDFGMHHFHLSIHVDETGFVKRSDYLLFAVITQEYAYFVDVRLHHDAEALGWVRQELLKIVNSNWPELIEARTLHGILGSEITDLQRKELRRKNINVPTVFEGNAYISIGGSTTADGSSTSCRMHADRLLREIRRHQSFFDGQPSELLSALKAKGIQSNREMKFELVTLEDLNPPAGLVEKLGHEKCMSKDLSNIGFMIVEANTRTPIVVSIPSEDKSRVS